MTRVRVNAAPPISKNWWGRIFEVDAIAWIDGKGQPYLRVRDLSLIFSQDEVREIVSHRGEYDPEHWGEVDPDAWDRMGYEGGYKGRHLLHTGTE